MNRREAIQVTVATSFFPTSLLGSTSSETSQGPTEHVIFLIRVGTENKPALPGQVTKLARKMERIFAQNPEASIRKFISEACEETGREIAVEKVSFNSMKDFICVYGGTLDHPASQGELKNLGEIFGKCLEQPHSIIITEHLLKITVKKGGMKTNPPFYSILPCEHEPIEDVDCKFPLGMPK